MNDRIDSRDTLSGPEVFDPRADLFAAAIHPFGNAKPLVASEEKRQRQEASLGGTGFRGDCGSPDDFKQEKKALAS